MYGPCSCLVFKIGRYIKVISLTDSNGPTFINNELSKKKYTARYFQSLGFHRYKLYSTMQHVIQSFGSVLIIWEAFTSQFIQMCHLNLAKPFGICFTLRHSRIKAEGVFENWWGICLAGTSPNDSTKRGMTDSDGWGSARSDLAFRVDRNQQSKGAERPLLPRSSGQDYISTGSGVRGNWRKLLLSKWQYQQQLVSCITLSQCLYTTLYERLTKVAGTYISICI